MTGAMRHQRRDRTADARGRGVRRVHRRRPRAHGRRSRGISVERALAIHADVTDESAVMRAARLGRQLAGTVSTFVVNNAGIAGPQTPAGTTDLAEWERTIGVNLTGTFLVSKHAIEHLVSARGCIVNVASALAMIGWRRECAYGPGKAGVVQFTKSMALDYAPDVRVNCICPGAVRTPMIESVLPQDGDTAALLREYGKVHPLYRRFAEFRKRSRMPCSSWRPMTPLS
jgi:dihydroanticapsin dehydrogenase